MEINIPGIFKAANSLSVYGNLASAKGNYGFETREGGKASACIACVFQVVQFLSIEIPPFTLQRPTGNGHFHPFRRCVFRTSNQLLLHAYHCVGLVIFDGDQIPVFRIMGRYFRHIISAGIEEQIFSIRIDRSYFL